MHYNTRSGLASDNVDCIYQDHEGFIWLGTDQGLSLFDGLRFTNFHHDPNNSNSIGANHVLDIKEDPDGTLWLAIENMGLCRINKERYLIENYPIPIFKEVEERYINTFQFDHDGRILVATERGLLIFDINQKKYTPYPIIGYATPIDVVGISEDAYGTAWGLGYTGELMYRKKGQNSFKRFDHHTSIGVVMDWEQFNSNSFAISTSSGLFMLNCFSNPLKSTLDKKNNIGGVDAPDKIFSDQAGNFWIANKKKKLFVYLPGKGYLQSLDDAWITGVDVGLPLWRKKLIDKDGNVWLVGEKGVYLYDKDKNQVTTYGAIERYNTHNSNGVIASVESYRHYIIYITNSSLIVFDINGNKVVYECNGNLALSEGFVFNSILRLADGHWLVATNDGLWSLNESNGIFKLYKNERLTKKLGLQSKEVLWLTSDSKNGIWISTVENGLLYFDQSTERHTTYLKAFHENDTMRLHHIDFTEMASDGTVAARTHYGFALKLAANDHFIPASSFVKTKLDWSQLEITDLQFHKGLWFLSTQGRGLWAMNLKKGTIKVYTQKDGLPSNYISSLLDDENRLLLGSSKGLSIFNVEKEVFTNYFESDGFPSDQFIVRGHGKDEQGKMYFTTTGGLISFYTDSLKHTNKKPLIRFSSAIIDNQELGLQQLAEIRKTKKIVLDYGENLVLNFSPLTYNGLSDFILRYRLHPKDEWRIGQSGLQVSLDNIDPEVYDLEVQLIDKNGNMMSDAMKMTIDIIPPYWKKPLFQIFVLSCLLFVLIYFVNWKAKQKSLLEKRRFEAINLVERERTRIAMELHDDIGGNLTAVSLMTSMLQSADLHTREKNIVNNISEASDRMVDEMNEIVWALTASNDSLSMMVAYIREHAQHFFAHTQVQLSVDNEDILPEMQIVSRIRRNIFLIYKESVHNILKHSSANKVLISFKRYGNEFMMEIKDNGTPLDKPAVGTSTGNGMGNMRRRASEIGGMLNVIKENGHTVQFSIPINRLMNVN